MVQDTDLSEYEKIRLANIKRNADFLSSMGFSVRPDNGTERPKVEKKSSSSGGGVKKPR
jgi:translation initiation factor RLI1